jgi:threonine/homoserine efflux transporter RhtA
VEIVATEIACAACLLINIALAWNAEDDNDFIGATFWGLSLIGYSWFYLAAAEELGLSNDSATNQLFMGLIIGQLVFLPICMKINERKRRKREQEEDIRRWDERSLRRPAGYSVNEEDP